MPPSTFGISLPGAGPIAAAQPLREIAQAAERLGYDTVWVSDHIIGPQSAKSIYPYGGGGPFSVPQASTYFEPLTTLAWIAGGTERVRLGISVLVIPLRNPVYAGKVIATLDALSAGRVTLGIGVGWLEEEFEALGEMRFAQRGAITDEWIEIYRTLWAQDEISQHSGTHYQFGGVRSFPKPTQRPLSAGEKWPGPPIWVGGNSRPALRRVAHLGDGWQGIRMDSAETAACLAQLEVHLREVGRTRAEITISTRLNLARRDTLSGDAEWELSGSADHAAEQVNRFIAVGSQDFLLTPQPRDSAQGMIETMEWFAREVRPLL
jgi:probable F420-dependent oxidoreductase